MSLRFALLLSLLVVPAASGQALKTILEAEAPPAARADGCSLGAAATRLNESDVEAELYNLGALFWRSGGGSTYEVPKGSGVGTFFTAGLWVSGLVGGEVRFAGASYHSYEFWPGPLDASGQTDAATCEAFDRMWTVTASDIEAYEANPSGIVALDLREWPVAYGAPFYVDANGNGRNDPDAEPVVELDLGDDGYGTRTLDLAAGERPLLLGDQAVFWIMNDAGNEHLYSGLPALGIEVRVLAFVIASPDPAIGRSTFYRYTIHNRSDETIEDSRVSLFADYDLGNFGDDYLASDSTRGMMIGYNGREVDKGEYGYGDRPPAIGLDVLSGAQGVMRHDELFSVRGIEGRRLQESRWNDGAPLTVGGYGRNRGEEPITRWIYGGDPVRYAFWTEENINGEGETSLTGDRRAVVNAPPVTLAPGESRRFDLAILFARGDNRLHSVAKLRAASDSVQSAYDRSGLGAIRDVAVGPGPALPSAPAAPALLTPTAGIDFDAMGQPDSVTFAWSSVPEADVYYLRFGTDPVIPASFEGIRTIDTTVTVSARRFPFNTPAPSFWRVVGVNWGGVGAASETRPFTYTRTVYVPGVLRLGDGQPAFVEVAGPGGIDPCGPEAASTDGCAEVGGNGVYESPNATSDYLAGSLDLSSQEESLRDLAPRDVEIRFTEAGSYGFLNDPSYPSGQVVRVPFEIWDVGVVRIGEENDPADDLRLIPTLLTDVPRGDEADCAFDYVGPTRLGAGPVTQDIFGIYVDDDDYAAFAAAAAAVIGDAPGGCVPEAASDEIKEFRDWDRVIPIENFFLEQGQPEDRDPVGIDGLTGTVIRFYTTDPPATPAETIPEMGGLSLAVHPNPVRSTASVPYTVTAPGQVRLRVVDVLGREVAVLEDGERPAGDHRATLDTAGLAPGVYVVVLDTEAGRAARTITLVR